ncbi:MAG: glycosyltransferase [Nitrospirae bacterium]|nr:glycosyltransferase [Candidatus Manganitrophaceae bacterium]
MKKQTHKKIRIAFLVHTYGFGGLENMVTNLVNHLDPSRFESTIISFAPLKPLNGRVDPKRVQVISLNKKGGNNPILIYKICLLLKKIGADIVQTHNWGTAFEGILGAKLARVPAIIHAERGTIEDKRHNIILQRFLWSFPNQILSVSQAHRQKMTDLVGFPHEQIRAIVNGVDTDLFFPNPEIKKEIRKKLGLKKDSFCIGTVGSLRPVKNQLLLINACKTILHNFENVEVMIVGEGPLKAQLKQEVKTLGFSEKIHFAGGQTNIPEILNALDVFVLPSLSEGMPNAVLEAMACGIPVIATSVGGVPEVIEDGKNGMLISSGDEEALILSLGEVIQDQEKRLSFGIEAQRRAKTYFSLKNMVSEYQMFYESLLQKVGR